MLVGKFFTTAKREALHCVMGSVKTTLLFTLEESKMPVEDIYNQSLADAVRKGMRDGMKRALARESGVDPNNRAEMARYLMGVMREAPAYSAAEVCLHSFTHDTGVCMSCGMSEASVRLGVAKAKPVESTIPTFNSRDEWEDHVRTHGHCRAYVAIDGELWEQLGSMGAWRKHGPLPKDDNGIPYDPSAWARLAESFEQREAAVGKSPAERIFEDMQDLWIKQLEISTAVRAQSMTKTEALIHHLTSVLGSREKALDHWKECHLAERAKKNARTHADYNDSAAMTQGLYEHGRAQELEQAMNVPIAAEKSMRAQLLLREDE